MVDFKPYDTTLAAAGTCQALVPTLEPGASWPLGPSGEGSWGAERMGWLPPPQCGVWGTRSQESGRLLGQALSGQSPFRARQGTCCGYAGLGEDCPDWGAPWLERRRRWEGDSEGPASRSATKLMGSSREAGPW